ncbi:D-alanyl-D-alanine carboxypeptidase [Escherichia coli]|uniref:D-alanyl-D-alanine carboxypeptidase n=1 Tax=Escherichia coli TaxID=562 RepID=A0A2X3KHY2_ECOLX|nr:D-alanyl-D-alanine carboxypeptidase [Escherichia coli]
MTQYSSLLRGLAAGSAFLFLFAPTAFAAEQTVEAPSVDARAWILMDYASGKVLAEGNADEKLDPASLTKIMTSYVVGQALKADKIKLTDMVTVGKDCLGDGKSGTAWFIGNVPQTGRSGFGGRLEQRCDYPVR